MVSTTKQPHYTTAMCYQPEIFPLCASVFRPYLPSARNKATETVIFFFGKIFIPAAAAAGGSSSSRQAATNICPLERIIIYRVEKKCIINIIFFPGIRPQNNKIILLLKIVVMPNFFFPGARPPNTTFRNQSNLTRTLIYINHNKYPKNNKNQ